MNISMVNSTFNDNQDPSPNVMDPNIFALRELGQQYEQILFQYEQSLQNYYNNINTQNSTISNGISMDNSELQNLNAELTSLNNQIMQVMGNTYPEYQQQINERSMMNSELLNQLNALIAEKNKVNKTINYYDSLNKEKNNALIVLTDNYYSYIIYLLLVIILIVIFVLILFKVDVFKDIGDTINDTIVSGVEQLGGKITRHK